MRRRDVLQLGPVAAFATVLPLPALAASRSIATVVDERYAAARTIAAASRSATYALPADPLDLWHDGARAATRVIGLTGYADMLMFADLARHSGRRMTTRIAHHLGGADVLHVLHTGTASTALLEKAGTRWPIALWSLLGGNGSAPIERNDREGTLWSWTID